MIPCFKLSQKCWRGWIELHSESEPDSEAYSTPAVTSAGLWGLFAAEGEVNGGKEVVRKTRKMNWTERISEEKGRKRKKKKRNLPAWHSPHKICY